MRAHSTAYWIGSCECGQGVLIIRQWINSGNYVIMCDDCESEWKHPDLGDSNRLPLHSGNIDQNGEIRNPTLEEIEGIGWSKYIEGNSIDYFCV